MTVSTRPAIGVLGGMGPLASAAFLQTIYRLSSGGPEQEMPKVIVYSDPTIPDRTRAFLDDASPGGMIAILNDRLRGLASAGVSRIVICCVTMHHLMDRVDADLRPRVVSLVDAIADALRDEDGPYVMACTTGTRRLRVLERHPVWREIEHRVRWLDDEDQETLHDMIYELKRGASPAALQAWLTPLPAKYRVKGVIAGCTELHLLAAARHAGRGSGAVNVMDPLDIVARQLCGVTEADEHAVVHVRSGLIQMLTTHKPIAEIVATGRYLPDGVMLNSDFTKFLDTSDDWIRNHTGIEKRRIAPDTQSASDMGARAARIAMARADIVAEQIDLIVVSTATVDRLLPATACDVQAMLGATNAAAYDVSAGCSGFLYALSVVEGHLAAGGGEIALVVSTEKMSAIIDWDDRATCVLFGDGAGAAIVRKSANGRGVLSSFLRSDGKLAELIWRPAGGARIPMTEEVLGQKSHLVKMSGPQVFRAAVRCMSEAAERALAAAGLTTADIDLFIPHQANRLIMEATARNIGIPLDRVFMNVDRYGNMSSATIPIALDEAEEQGYIKEGSHVLLVAFGAGVTWAAAVMRC